MNAEETLSARGSRAVQEVGGTSQAAQPARQDKKRREKTESSYKVSRLRREERRSPPGRAAEPERRHQHFTPLVAIVEQILEDLRADPDPKWPVKLRSNLDRRPKNKYCHFHKDHGHDKDDCFELKNHIEELIQRGRLQRFVAGKS